MEADVNLQWNVPKLGHLLYIFTLQSILIETVFFKMELMVKPFIANKTILSDQENGSK